MNKRVGVFGSAFNPPTKGHENAFLQFENEFDEIWLVPSYAHAFGKNPLPFEMRCNILSLFLENIGSEKIKISKIEELFYKTFTPKYVYTYDLLLFLKDKYPNYDFEFICGEDNADPERWAKFKNSDKIDKEFGKKVAKVKKDIRSTYVRNAFKDKEYDKLKELIYDNVLDFIKCNNLY